MTAAARVRCALPLLAALAGCSASAGDAADGGRAGDGGARADRGAGAGTEGPGEGGSGAPGASCTAARAQQLGPVDAVSSGAVRVLSDDGVVMTLLIDARAGGTPQASKNPFIYVNLETGTRVDVTDVDAAESIEWDLAIKRPVLFTNGGDGGPGTGGAVFLPGAEFEAVTRADAERATYATESFFDAECAAQVDARGDLRTSFSGWYDYEMATHKVTPKAGAWLVRGAAGALFKVRIVTFAADAEGREGGATGRYVLQTVTL